MLLQFLFQGKIEFQGTFVELQAKRIDFLHALSVEESKGDSEVVEVIGNNVLDVSLASGIDRDDEEAEPEETEELMAKGNLSKSLYWKYFRAGGSVIMIFCFLFTLMVGQIGSSGCDYWVAYWLVDLLLLLTFNINFILICLLCCQDKTRGDARKE